MKKPACFACQVIFIKSKMRRAYKLDQDHSQRLGASLATAKTDCFVYASLQSQRQEYDTILI